MNKEFLDYQVAQAVLFGDKKVEMELRNKYPKSINQDRVSELLRAWGNTREFLKKEKLVC